LTTSKNSELQHKASVLDASVNAAFERGDYEEGLSALRSLSVLMPDEPEIVHRLGVVEEQIGDMRKAFEAHARCLELAPDNPIAYLYAGYSHAQQGHTSEALRLYSLGSDLEHLFLEPKSGDDPTSIRFQDACKALRTHFSSLHRASVGPDADCKRIHDAIWTRTHDNHYSLSEPGQVPQLFYIPSLKPAAFFDSTVWEWSSRLEAATADICTEFTRASRVLENEGRPYLDSESLDGETFAKLLGSKNWTALDLFRDGQPNRAVSEHFPLTLAALNSVPLYGLDETPFEVFFSVLKSQQHIKPHYGLSNHSLTLHLPLITPHQGKLTVKGESRDWRFGQLLAFDDTYLHEAQNQSEQDRVVLIFSIWHPELSAAERSAIQRSFNARNAWLAAR